MRLDGVWFTPKKKKVGSYFHVAIQATSLQLAPGPLIGIASLGHTNGGSKKLEILKRIGLTREVIVDLIVGRRDMHVSLKKQTDSIPISVIKGS